MGRKPRVDRSPEEKWQIVQEGMLPQGSRGENMTLTTDNGTQFTSWRFLETLGRLGITHRRTAHHHPEGNS